MSTSSPPSRRPARTPAERGLSEPVFVHRLAGVLAEITREALTTEIDLKVLGYLFGA